MSPPSRLPLAIMLCTTGLSQAGNTLTAVAVPWFVLQLTGSAAKTGMTGAIIVIPTIIAGIVGGALVDRLGYRRTSIVADLASGFTVAMIPLIHLTVGVAFWQVLVLMFLSALLDTPGSSARQSMVPELAARAGYQLEPVNSAFSSVTRAAQLAGPLLAGFLITFIGPANVLWINALTFVVSAALVTTIIPTNQDEPDIEQRSTDYLTEMLDGVRFVWRDRLLLRLVLVASVLNIFANPLAAVVLPVYADEVYGSAAQLGLMLAGYGGGALVGTLLYGTVTHRVRRRTMFVWSLFGATIPFGILALTPGILVTAAALFAFGIMLGPGTPIFMTVVQERTPEKMRGRVFGLLFASVWIVLPIGMLGAGLLLETLGLVVTLAIEAGMFLLFALVVFADRVLYDLDNEL